MDSRCYFSDLAGINKKMIKSWTRPTKLVDQRSASPRLIFSHLILYEEMGALFPLLFRRLNKIFSCWDYFIDTL